MSHNWEVQGVVHDQNLHPRNRFHNHKHPVTVSATKSMHPAKSIRPIRHKRHSTIFITFPASGNLNIVITFSS